MSNNRKKINIPEQRSLFETLQDPASPMPGDFDNDSRIRTALSEAIKKSGKDRYEIAMIMSRLLGTDVTKTMIDSWTAPSRDAWQVPANKIAAFCEATGNSDVIRIVLEPLKKRMAFPGEDRLSELGRIELEIKRLGSRRRELLKVG